MRGLTLWRLSDTFGTVETMLSQAMKANPEVEKKLSKNFTTQDAVSVTQQQAGRAAQATIDAAWALVAQNRKVMDELLAEHSSNAEAAKKIKALISDSVGQEDKGSHLARSGQPPQRDGRRVQDHPLIGGRANRAGFRTGSTARAEE